MPATPGEKRSSPRSHPRRVVIHGILGGSPLGRETKGMDGVFVSPPTRRVSIVIVDTRQLTEPMALRFNLFHASGWHVANVMGIRVRADGS